MSKILFSTTKVLSFDNAYMVDTEKKLIQRTMLWMTKLAWQYSLPKIHETATGAFTHQLIDT